MTLPPSARWFQALLDAEGLATVDITQNKHLKVLVRRGDGATRKFVVPVSSSDHRAHKNARSQLRRFASGT